MARTPGTIENRRELIIEAAIKVFAEKGFDASSNRDIAKEANITTGLIYHYFKSKNDLLWATIEENPTRQLLRAIPPEISDLPTHEFLRSVAMNVLELTKSEKFIRLIRIYLSEVLRNPQIIPTGTNTIQKITETITKSLDTKMKSGDLRAGNPALIAQIFVGALMDIVLRNKIIKEKGVMNFTDEQIVNSLVELTMRGIEKK